VTYAARLVLLEFGLEGTGAASFPHGIYQVIHFALGGIELDHRFFLLIRDLRVFDALHRFQCRLHRRRATASSHARDLESHGLEFFRPKSCSRQDGDAGEHLAPIHSGIPAVDYSTCRSRPRRKCVCADPPIADPFRCQVRFEAADIRIELCQVADSELRWRYFSCAFRPAPEAEIPTWTAARCVV
jgi:hypothetical protein